MLEQITTKLTAQSVNLQSKTWVFFSAFDEKGGLLASNGVIRTDRTLENIIQSFYTWILKKIELEVKSIIFDIVGEIRLERDINVLKQTPLDQYGIFIVEGEWQNSWVLLPNTKGITNIAQAVQAIKKKYNLQKPQVSIYIFKTRKIEIKF